MKKRWGRVSGGKLNTARLHSWARQLDWVSVVEVNAILAAHSFLSGVICAMQAKQPIRQLI